jgi:hypothetical protein
MDKIPTNAELAVDIKRLDLAIALQGQKLEAAVKRLDAYDAFIARQPRPRKQGK